jgi:hypothetical protein
MIEYALSNIGKLQYIVSIQTFVTFSTGLHDYGLHPIQLSF